MLAFLQALPPALVLPLAFVMPALEASTLLGVVFPGEAAILVAGAAAHTGGVPLWGVVAAGVSGAVAGDAAGFALGRRYGDRIVARLPERLVRPVAVESVRALLRRRGGAAVFIGRFTALLRALVPGLAGASGLGWSTFLPYNVAGGAVWATGVAVLGYLAGVGLETVARRLGIASEALLAAVVLLLVAAAAVRHRRRTRETREPQSPGGPAVTDSRSARQPRPQRDVDVLVVGAGPVGLTAALELRRRGVGCRIIDRLGEPLPYAKAVGVQPRTLELWEAAGLLPRVLDAAIPMRGQLLFADGEQVGRIELELPPDVPFGFIALPQYETERLLAERLAELGCTVERGVELTGFAQDGDGVTATLRGPRGESRVRSCYLVGCDGAHSAVRKGLGVTFSGDAFAEQYMLGDVEVDWSLPPGYALRAVRHRDGLPDDLLVAIPLPGEHRYRMSMLVPDELSAPGRAAEHGVTPRPAPELHHIQAVLDRLAPEPTQATRLRWSSVFRISHRIVDSYGRGRVFLAGDAAHIHPPTGAQGMNTGIQDAVALAWRLALASRGVAADGLLASYDAERRPVGEEVVGRTVRHAREGFETSDPAVVLRREAQLLVSYRGSLIVGEGSGSELLTGGPGPGDRAPDARGLGRDAVAFGIRLFEVLDSRRHTLLLYADDAAQLPGLLAAARAARDRVHGDLDTRLVLAKGLAVGEVFSINGTPVPVLHDEAGQFRAAYAAVGGCGYLVRPDGHVGFRAGSLRTDELCRQLATTFAGAATPEPSSAEVRQ